VAEYAGEAEDDGVFEVDRVMDEAVVGRKKFYLIKWKVRAAVWRVLVEGVCACLTRKPCYSIPSKISPRALLPTATTASH